MDCKKNRDHGSLGSQSRSVKHVKAWSNFLACDSCGRCHPGDCWRKIGVCLRCRSKELKAQDCFLTLKSGMFWLEVMVVCRKIFGISVSVR